MRGYAAVLFHDFASWAPSTLLTLAGLAQPEDWWYRHTSSERAVPILRNYLVYTFRRAHFQGRVPVVEEDGAKLAAFNTGLLTPHFERIFGLFVERAVVLRELIEHAWHQRRVATSAP